MPREACELAGHWPRASLDELKKPKCCLDKDHAYSCIVTPRYPRRPNKWMRRAWMKSERRGTIPESITIGRQR